MASGQTLLIFTALNNQPPASNGAGFGVRNGTPVLAFDQTTQESSVFGAVMPQHYAGTAGITVYLHWAAAGTTGTVGWDVAFERVGDGQLDIDGDSFATAGTITAVSAPATSGLVDIGSVAFADGSGIDSLVAGEYFRVRVRRDVANDTLAADAHLVAVELRET